MNLYNLLLLYISLWLLVSIKLSQAIIQKQNIEQCWYETNDFLSESNFKGYTLDNKR